MKIELDSQYQWIITCTYIRSAHFFSFSFNEKNKNLQVKFEVSKKYVLKNALFIFLISERYHSIDTKMKGNPLSLEEMILMTIYS